ncbi:MAG: 30S ribosomal protein S6 [Fimbriimonadaceae bacterium]|nr:30S ribosomal protein S6 [Fimbriimonadaceae bacterium]
MREYELMVIMHPDLDGAQLTATLDAMRGHLTACAELTACDLLGRRRLAYEVRRCMQGTYALLNFTTDPSNILELRRFLRVDLHDQVIRHLLVKDEKRGTRPPSQPMPGEETTEELSEEDRLAQAAAERAALEEAARGEAEPVVAAEPAAVEAAPVAEEPATE